MKKYEAPTIEVVRIAVEDIVTTSWVGGGTETPPDEFE